MLDSVYWDLKWKIGLKQKWLMWKQCYFTTIRHNNICSPKHCTCETIVLAWCRHSYWQETSKQTSVKKKTFVIFSVRFVRNGLFIYINPKLVTFSTGTPCYLRCLQHPRIFALLHTFVYIKYIIHIDLFHVTCSAHTITFQRCIAFFQ